MEMQEILKAFYRVQILYCDISEKGKMTSSWVNQSTLHRVGNNCDGSHLWNEQDLNVGSGRNGQGHTVFKK